MRKIVSKHKSNRKNKRNQLISGLILIFIMFFGIFGYSLGRGSGEKVEKIEYNGFEFIKQNNFWLLNIESFNFAFKYNPYEVEEIDSEVNYFDSYLGQPLYIYSENAEADLEIYKNLNQVVLRMQYACLLYEKCEGDLPLKTCKDNFIIIKNSDENSIVQKDNCVYIYGNEENLTKVTDEFLFKIIGIR